MSSSQSTVQNNLEPARRMIAEERAELIRKGERAAARSARRKANKAAFHEASARAVEMQKPDPPAGYGVEYGSQKLVNGKPFGPRSFKYVKLREVITEWKDDPYVKEMVAKEEEESKKKAIEDALKNWPWGHKIPRGLVALAPYLLNELRDSSKPGQPFLLPEAEQNCLLFQKLFSVDLIAKKLIDIMFIHQDTAKRFALTSRRSAKEISRNIGHWDVTRGKFGHCEIERDRFDGDNLIAEPIQGSVPSVVVVSPVRGPFITPRNIEQLDEVDEKADKIREKRLYEGQVQCLHKMCKATYNFADYFRNLQLHQVPFLTMEILSLIIPPMRNLKVLGVYNCQLIHIGHTLPLLQLIQVDKVQEKKNQISLDFCPNFHAGPPPGVEPKYCTGNYHVTWDNWNGDSRIGIWQLVSRIIPQALKQNQDFLGFHTAFRQWLDKSPCWRVAETLATLQRLPGDTRTDDKIDEDFVVMVDSPFTGGNKNKFMSKVPNRSEGWQWMLQRHPCFQCGLNPLGIFFWYKDIKDARDYGQHHMICLACRLCNHLDKEQDHHKPQKRALIAHWLQTRVQHSNDPSDFEMIWNDTNMPKALLDFTDREVVKKAHKLDVGRWNGMNRILRVSSGENKGKPILSKDGKPIPDDPYDRETVERQKEFTKTQLGRDGLKNISPTAGSKDPPEVDMWNWFDPSRRFAHGH